MELKNFLKTPEIKAEFIKEFPKIPEISKNPLLAEPKNERSIVGIALPYMIANAYKYNREFEGVNVFSGYSFNFASIGDTKYNTSRRIKEIINKQNHLLNQSEFIKNGEPTEDLAELSFTQAQLEIFTQNQIFKGHGFYNNNDIIDLLEMYEIYSKIRGLKPKIGDDMFIHLYPEKIDIPFFKTDIIFKNKLIDITTTKNKHYNPDEMTYHIKRDRFFKLIGKYILAEAFGLINLPEKYKIKNIGICYTRFQQYEEFEVKHISKDFKKWFVERLEKI